MDVDALKLENVSISSDSKSPIVDEAPAKATSLLDTNAEITVHLADPQADPNSIHHSASTFESLNLNPELLKGVYAMGFQKPSKIQAKALPLLMATPHKNFIGQSQSGTGKTGAFVLALLSRMKTDDPSRVQAIVLAPTRELANQILTVVKQMSQFSSITSTQALKESVPRGESVSANVVVGTPGTLLDLTRRRAIEMQHVSMFIVDEADVMLDKQGMGDQTLRVKRDEVRIFAERIVPDANMISLKREELSVDAIKQLYLDCTSEQQKYETLCSIYGLCNIGQSIIFCHRRDTTDTISFRMQQDGHQVTVIHGGMDPTERDRIFNMYRSGETKVLITTNVMARGIDVLDVNLVINYDLPLDQDNRPDYETYLHRIGRTGRFGRTGISINFVHDERSRKNLLDIERYFGKQIRRIGTEDLMTLEKQLKDALKNR